MISDTKIPHLEKGIALDIDETLSRTIGYRIEQMQKEFWNPENLSTQDMADKYRYTQNVPYRQTPEANKWINEQIYSSKTQEELPIIEWAKDTVSLINKTIPITAYITVRPTTVLKGTQKRLQKHNFPQAPIIMRPDTIKQEKWNERKARVLEKAHPQVLWIVDDNDGLVKHISKKYKWTIFLYNHTTTKESYKGKNVKICNNRNKVYNEVKNTFKT